MAQTGYTPIKIYSSATASTVPTAGNLAAGELAINTTDEKLYFKNTAGTVKLLASSSSVGGGTVTSVAGTGTVNGITLTGTVTSTGNLTLGGSLSGTASININGTVGATTATTGAFTTTTASTACRINATAAVTANGERLTILFDPYVDQGIVLKATTANSGNAMVFFNTSTPIGSIYQTTTNVSYLTSSDYRLKNSIAPMTGALAKVALLKPCTYKWNVDGSDSQGFIAHELQEVAPYAVIGKKDGEQMQGVDYGRITPILTAALQETITKIEVLEARIAALEAK